jgi:general transcription factor IIIA
MPLHEENAPSYVCGFEGCTRVYTSEKNKTAHINAYHLKTKTFPCSICSQVFLYKHVLERHMLVHDENRKTKRKTKERQPLSLVETLTGDQGTNTTHPCTIENCPLEFLREYDLHRHLESAHDITDPVALEQ